MNDRRNIRALANSQISRLAQSNAVNRAYGFASRLRTGPEQAEGNNTSGADASAQPAQSWSQWAWDKLPKRPSTPNQGIEKVSLFPGWCTRRFEGKVGESQFLLDLYITGYASSLRPPELATRPQKAFMRVAKGFAALPGIPIELETTQMLAVDQSLAAPEQGPSKQNSMDSQESEEMRELQAQLARLPPESRPGYGDQPNQTSSIPLAELKRMHETLDQRLQPFWSSSLSNRAVLLSVFAIPENVSSDEGDSENKEPIFSQEVLTDQQGVFIYKTLISYENLCTNPDGLAIAFGPPLSEPKLLIKAELLPPVPVVNPGAAPEETKPAKRVCTSISVAVSQAPVRLLSDIDDTVKVAEVLAGVKTVFHNAFVKHLEELVVKGMPEWYQLLYNRGVRFHYVSNSPFEMLPLLIEFFKLANLPEGSLRLKFYGGRSLFHGLWAPAGERKRAGVIEILDNFMDSRFFLVGDTGEQDLELYTEMAIERPQQILGIFLRDVVPAVEAPAWNTAIPLAPITTRSTYTDEPESFAPSSSGSSTPSFTNFPYQPRTRSGTDPNRPKVIIQQQPQPRPGMQLTPSPSTDDVMIPGRDPWLQRNGQPQQQMTPAERRRWELDLRIQRARDSIPPHIVFRVFRNADENVEALDILKKLRF